MKSKGHPRAFKTEEAFEKKFIRYLEKCNEKELFANIAGFCVFARITRETYYAQKNYYSDTFNHIELALEDYTLQDKNTSRMIFYLKNKFGYKDKQEIESTNHNLNEEITQLTPEERKARIRELTEKNKNG